MYDMNKFFQDLLYRFLRENLSGLIVKHEYSLRDTIDYLPEFNPQKRSAMVPRPDFAIFKGSELISILDAKYRDLWEHPLPREMLYQIGIYAVSQGLNGTATILYPASASESREARIGINVNDPVHGKGLAQVVLRPVDLNYIEKLVLASYKSNSCENERKAYANKLAFGY
jgi:5-methylcytosine-specific restriction enzyme subunit McrC